MSARATHLPKTELDEARLTTYPALGAVLAFSCGLNLLMLTSPIYMLQVYDRVITTGRLETLLYLTLIVAVALAVLGAMDAVRGVVLSRVGAWLQRRMAPVLIAASLRAAVNGAPSSAQALRDLTQIQSFLGSSGIVPFIDAPWVPFFVIVLWLLHPWMGVFALCSALVLFGFALWNEMATRKAMSEANQANVVAVGQAEAAIRNAEVVEALGMTRTLIGRYEEQSNEALLAQSRASETSAHILGTTKFLRLFLQSAILGLGALLVVSGDMTPGGMIAGSILLARALAPVEQAIGTWRNFISARTSHDRLQALLRASATLDKEGMLLPPPTGRLSIESLVYVPPGSNKPVLRGISFEVQPGEVIGVIGPSAAGKSTLCRLIVGIYKPTQGHVRLDGADVTHWNREQFGHYVGYLPQDVELFQGTVRQNIARMGEGEPEWVVSAAQSTDVHEMILRLPKSYDTEIGPRGHALSGGQRQRIGLARALYCDPKLIVLDEPNSSLDADGEMALQETISRLKAYGTTVIMVAHRPSALTHVDKVLVLQNGAVTHFGPRDEVLQAMSRRGPVAVKTPAGAAGAVGEEGARRVTETGT